MNPKLTKWLSGLGVAAISVVLLAGCDGMKWTGNTATSPKPKIKVVAAENFYGEVAQAVGGDHVVVTSILTNPQQDPHEYEPTAEASKAVADAQIVVFTGLGYDDWMAKLLNAVASDQSKEVVPVGRDIAGKTAGDNPHVWYDPATMPKLAQALADDLGKLDPANAQDYQKNARNYIASLAPLTTKVSQIRQTKPVAIDVSEPIFDYMADALNLKVNDPKFAKGVEEGGDPSAEDIATVQQDVKDKKIKLLVYNTQTDNPTVDNIVKLAEANGIAVIRVTETEPAGENYLQWMTSQLEQVEKAVDIHL